MDFRRLSANGADFSLLARVYGAVLVAVSAAVLVAGNTVNAAACTVSAPGFFDTVSLYKSQCSSPVADCDPVDGLWFCSSQRFEGTPILSEPAFVTANSNSTAVDDVRAVASRTSSCQDSDGDGWGWNGVASCQVQSQSTESATSYTDQISTVIPSNRCVDEDGDGWGWDGRASCRVSAYSSSSNVSNVSNVNNVNNGKAQSVTYVDSTARCSGPYNAHHITDVVLVTGQSNVTGADTSVSATLDQWEKVVTFHEPDSPHPRVFAWTVDTGNNNAGTGWKVAALNQSWHDSAPGVGGIARNNFGFHFAKHVVKASGCRVVGLIMVSEGGKGISHWDYNAPGWGEVVRHVNEAISAIGRHSIDGVLWHQGESDWIADGTCYTGSTCRNNLPDYYAQKLYSRIAEKSVFNPVGTSSLVDRLRRESWFSANKPFIAGETINAPVNVHLNKLNTDNDNWTACIHSDVNSGLGIRADDPYKNHYNAEGLRELGARYAAEYLRMTGNSSR